MLDNKKNTRHTAHGERRVHLRFAILLMFLWIWCFIVRAAKKIVYAHAIEVCQLEQNLCRNAELSQLIGRICRLMHLKKRSKLRLRTVVIFPKISDIFEYHGNHPAIA